MALAGVSLLAGRFAQTEHDEKARRVARACVETLIRRLTPGYASDGGPSAGLRALGASERWDLVQHRSYAEAAARECSVTGVKWLRSGSLTLRGEELTSTAWLEKRIWSEDDRVFTMEALHILVLTAMASGAVLFWCVRRRKGEQLEAD